MSESEEFHEIGSDSAADQAETNSTNAVEADLANDDEKLESITIDSNDKTIKDSDSVISAVAAPAAQEEEEEEKKTDPVIEEEEDQEDEPIEQEPIHGNDALNIEKEFDTSTTIEDTESKSLINEEPSEIEESIKSFEPDTISDNVVTEPSAEPKIVNDDDKLGKDIVPPLPERHNSIGSTQSNSGRSFKSWFNIKLKSANGSKDDVTDVTSITSELLNNEDNFDLILSRLHHNDEDIRSKSAKDREQFNVGTNTIRNTFNEIKEGVKQRNDDQLIEKIDWEFWSKVVNDYTLVVKTSSDLLLQKISNGIPDELRGMIWQLIANSKSFDLEQFFSNLKLETSQHERAIKRDLSRTRFMNNEQVKDKANEVFNIIKAYSLYDPEVGYTQGMAFITVPLLMNMTESESFCLLCSLMKNYDFRSLYLPEMPGLVLKLYQFDRLLEDLSPQLYNHLLRQGIRSSMYATQWFLTLFGYKFPLEMVLRIYDIVIAEGLETILKFAINLMIQNKNHLITLPFDELLRFLKDKLFYHYLIGSEEDSLQEITIESYRLDDLVKDSMEIKILPITLKKYELEFEEIHRLEKEREEEIESLRNKNGQLTREIRKLETSYSLLNKEHVEIANEMIQGKVKLATLEDENKNLQDQIKKLTEKLSNLEANEIDGNQLQKDLDAEISKTMQRNLEVMETNRLLEEQLGDLEMTFNKLSNEYDGLNVEHVNLKSRLRNLMG